MEEEIAQWLGMHAGVYLQVAHKYIEPYADRLITGKCCNKPTKIAAKHHSQVETRCAIEVGTYVVPSQLAERPSLLNRINANGTYAAGHAYTGEVPVGEPEDLMVPPNDPSTSQPEASTSAIKDDTMVIDHKSGRDLGLDTSDIYNDQLVYIDLPTDSARMEGVITIILIIVLL